MAPEGAAGDSVPTTTAAGCVPRDGARGPFLRPPSHAMDAFPVMALGCPIRTRWRSGRSNHRVESYAGVPSHGSLVPAQRLAHQPRRPDRLGTSSRHDSTENRHDLARRNGVGWMRWLGGTTPEGRADVPTVLAPEGAAWHAVRGRSSATRLGAMTVGCAACDTIRGRCPRSGSHHDGGRMRGLG
jgi:hypothetical protein